MIVRLKLPMLLVMGLLTVACSREEQRIPTATRPIRIAAPTQEDIEGEKREEILKQIAPVPVLVGGVNYETPDGEKWIRYPEQNILVHDLKRTDSTEARWGQTVTIAYVLTRPGQEKPIEKKTAENPMQFIVGTKSIISGMNMGVMGMRAGGKRRIFLPPELAYGKGGAPAAGIGPDEALIFEIELLSVTGEALEMPKDTLPPAPTPLGPPAPTSRPATGEVGIMSP